MKALRESKQGVLIDLVISPNAKKTEFVGEYGEALKLKIKAPPVDGKANEEIIRFLCVIFSVARSQVTLLRGETSKRKTVCISGLSIELANQKMSQIKPK